VEEVKNTPLPWWRKGHAIYGVSPRGIKNRIATFFNLQNYPGAGEANAQLCLDALSGKFGALKSENQEQARKIAAAIAGLERISDMDQRWTHKIADETLSLLRDGVKGEE
jgi:hypothetical protein